MASSPHKASKLSQIQKDVLVAFFAREHGFYLTGGAALAGYHLGHRETSDLELFTSDAAAFERARHVLRMLQEVSAARSRSDRMRPVSGAALSRAVQMLSSWTSFVTGASRSIP